ncbi:MAG: hypothetical protein ACR2H1_01215 [Limisphaerales bacterium]
MNANKPDEPSLWQKTPVANLVRYVPSGIYFARRHVNGKLIRKALKTDRISVAKLRLNDLIKEERQKAGATKAVAKGKMTFKDALSRHAHQGMSRLRAAIFFRTGNVSKSRKSAAAEYSVFTIEGGRSGCASFLRSRCSASATPALTKDSAVAAQKKIAPVGRLG